MKTPAKSMLSATVALVVGIVVGVGGLATVQSLDIPKLPGDIREIRRSDTKLTNPLLECGELSSSVSDQTLSKLRSEVQAKVDSAKAGGEVTYASIYFRDLNNGPWFGINQSDEFFPASLLKLPLAMSFYDKSEDDPQLLSREYIYEPPASATTISQPFGPEKNIVAHESYTVEELIDIMLQESSNESAVVLADVAGREQILQVYHDLGLDMPTFGQDYKIDTHRYASFFRILYNATYLDRSASEKILLSLSNASFKGGLRAGVPEDVLVSHKFGSREVDAGAKISQLHDCGIVYAPEKPYILCVMTQGKDFDVLAGFIKEISRIVYTNVVHR